MSQICLYFQLHQPWRLRPYTVFEVGNQHDYFATPEKLDFANQRVMEKVAAKSYRPMLRLLIELLRKYQEFRFAISCSGVFLEQLEQYTPDVVELLQQAVSTGRVEVLAETYYHSLASLYSPNEFSQQVKLHSQLVDRLFAIQPKVFRNTELIFTNQVALEVEKLGFQGILAEGADRILWGRSPTHLYAAKTPASLPVLLKHYKLSDDIAFRFSQRSWSEWPLTAEKYLGWLTLPFASNELINLFMDFETFGEHQWEAEGIFPFFAEVVRLLHEHPESRFVTPSQAVAEHESRDVFSAEEPVSWADVDRDITAWRGNSLQWDTLRLLYELEPVALAAAETDPQVLDDWRRLQTSDHFYYMCTKWANDGDVHAYFSPYGSPYQAYVNYNAVLADLKIRLGV